MKVLFYFNLLFLIFILVIYIMKMITVIDIINKKYMAFSDPNMNIIYRNKSIYSIRNDDYPDSLNYYLRYSVIDPTKVNDLTFLLLPKTKQTDILTKNVILPTGSYTEGPVSVWFSSINPDDYVLSKENPLKRHIIDIIIFFLIIILIILYIVAIIKNYNNLTELPIF